MLQDAPLYLMEGKWYEKKNSQGFSQFSPTLHTLNVRLIEVPNFSRPIDPLIACNLAHR